MALKDVLEDKKKKRTITIVGTIVIILVTAGVFSYEASSIEVKEVIEEEAAVDADEPDDALADEEETENHWEYEGTLKPRQSKDYSFTVKEGATKAVVKLDSVNDDADFDLYIYNPNDEEVTEGESATASKDEEFTITSGLIPGEWTATVKRYAIPIFPIDAEYNLVIDVYYE